MKLINWIFVFILFFHATDVEAVLDLSRCATFKDLLKPEQVAGRREWAMKCFPSQKSFIHSNREYLNTDTKQLYPAYPTFGIIYDDRDPANPANWFAPTDKDAPCIFPPDYALVSLCAANGCFTPEQKVLFADGYYPIGNAKQNSLKTIVTLSDFSSEERLDFKISPIDFFISDLVASEQTVLNIAMTSGGALRVTENHPLVDGEGRMRAANTLLIGESLVKSDNSPDPIVSITPEQFFGKVYNVKVQAEPILEKIIVAEGYLNGSFYFQDEGIKDLNRKLLRKSLITDNMVR